MTGFSRCPSRSGKEESLWSQFSLLPNSVHISYREGDGGLVSADNVCGFWRGSDGGRPWTTPRGGQGVVGTRRRQQPEGASQSDTLTGRRSERNGGESKEPAVEWPGSGPLSCFWKVLADMCHLESSMKRRRCMRPAPWRNAKGVASPLRRAQLPSHQIGSHVVLSSLADGVPRGFLDVEGI